MIVATKHLQHNFGRAAAGYDTHATFQRQQVVRVLQAAQSYFPERAQVLDVGCGTGRFAELARQAAHDWHITGLDVALPMVKQAAARCQHVLQAQATALPIADASLHGVVSSLCLQWVDDKPRVLAEISRVLRPGGVAVIATLGSGTLRELHATAQNSRVKLGLLPMETFAAYREMVQGSGLQVLACQRMEELHYYPSVEALLNSMRIIGAGNAGERRFIAPRAFARFIQHYEAEHAARQGIPATWEPILMVLQRPV